MTVLHSPQLDSSPWESTEAAPPTRLRVIVNRFVFRAMLFTMGMIAVVLYRVVPDKTVTWRFAKAQARNLLRMCGVRLRRSGLDRLGPGPYIFAPNHQSHLDIAALLGYLPGIIRFAAKKEVFAEPVLGMVLRTMGMIPVDRDDPAKAIELLNRRGSAFSTVIFPEGTRSLDGRLLPFKKGAFVAAIELGIPIVPVVCKGTAKLMPKGKFLSILPGPAELIVLEPISTTGMTYEDRDRLRELVRKKIEDELGRRDEAPSAEHRP